MATIRTILATGGRALKTCPPALRLGGEQWTTNDGAALPVTPSSPQSRTFKGKGADRASTPLAKVLQALPTPVTTAASMEVSAAVATTTVEMASAAV